MQKDINKSEKNALSETGQGKFKQCVILKCKGEKIFLLRKVAKQSCYKIPVCPYFVYFKNLTKMLGCYLN